MALANTLVTNEVKNAAGTEVEFQHLGQEGRTRTFSVLPESPNLQHRLKISHLETGVGVELRRRSLIRFDKTVIGVSTTPRIVSAYIVLDAPMGDLSANTEITNVIAELLSFCASTGANTTILYDCTGNGASLLVSGGL